MNFKTDKTKKALLAIAMLRSAINSFTQIFLNIYLITVTGDNLIVLISMFIGFIVTIVQAHVMMRVLTEKNAKIFYMASFVMLFMYTISLPLVNNISPVIMTIIIQILAASSKQFYYGTTEMVVMGANDESNMRQYSSSVTLMESIPVIITPFISGVAISKFSYNAVFIVMIVAAIILVVLSKGMQTFCLPEHTYDYNKIRHIIKQHKVSGLFIGHSLKTIAIHNVTSEFLLPLMLFIRVGSELSLGSWSSIFAIIPIVAISIYKKLKSKPNVILLAIIVVLGSLPIIVYPSVISVVILQLVLKTAGNWIDIESNSLIYALPSKYDFKEYKKEYNAYFNGYLFIFRELSVIITMVIYITLRNAFAITLSLFIFELMLIPASILIRKWQK